jgi:hypothetical protein
VRLWGQLGAQCHMVWCALMKQASVLDSSHVVSVGAGLVFAQVAWLGAPSIGYMVGRYLTEEWWAGVLAAVYQEQLDRPSHLSRAPGARPGAGLSGPICAGCRCVRELRVIYHCSAVVTVPGPG